MLRRLSIRLRLALLSSALLAVVVGTNFYLTQKLDANVRSVTRATELLGTIDVANGGRMAFGEMRYWMTDLAVSLLTLSEANARAARERMEKQLEALAGQKPELVAEVRSELAAFEKAANEAVDQYTNDQRVIGNTFLAEARIHSLAIDRLLGTLVRELEAEAKAARDRVVADVDEARRTSLLVVLLALVAGGLLTFFIVRSIAVPMRRLIGAIEGIGAGNLAVPIPPQGPDEIGLMARTLALFRDSLEQRNRLVAEREHERQTISAAIATISEGFVLYDSDDRIVLCNEHFREIYPDLADLTQPGTSFRQILDAVVARGLIDFFDRSAEEEWIAARLRQHAHPQGSVEYEYRGRWVRISESLVPGGGCVTVYTDITELKRRQIELEHARENAEAANRTKSQFLANMSHELRTPLNAIIGYGEMLYEDATESGQEELLPDLKKITDAGRHLLGVINDILDLSKIEAGKMDVFVEDIELAPLVDEVRSIIEPLAAGNGNVLEISCTAEIGTMRTDRTKLKQSLLNLLSNAGKFTKNGRLSLAVERLDGGAEVRFTVADTGIGMSEEQLGRLFQAFSQADASTTKKYGGTGLGLAITRHFCVMLGGEVGASSKVGAGSTFTITLPDQRAEQPAEPAPAPAASASATTVLVVDDDPAARELLASHLRREGYRVLHARGGEEALAKAREARPDAITLDVMMPKMDGWSVLTRVKNDPELCDIPVVVVTILAERGVGLSLGAAEFLTKPVDRGRLSAVLRRLLRRDGPVLLVEDDPDSCAATRRKIEKMGLEAATAANGREALQWLRANPQPSVILLDLMMPEMDGFAFLDALRAEPQWSEIAVVVLTAKELTQAERALLAGRTRQVLAKGAATAVEVTEAVAAAVRRRPAVEPAVAVI
jgi:signal transduction histidine kinase/DNA-binding response OmpR family regulator